MNPKFDHIPPMCILLKLHYIKFDVPRLFCSKVIEEKLWGDGLEPPLVKKGLNIWGLYIWVLLKLSVKVQ